MVNSRQGHDTADYKLKRIPKYMKAMVFLTFPHTQSYFSPLNKILKPKMMKAEVLWWWGPHWLLVSLTPIKGRCGAGQTSVPRDASQWRNTKHPWNYEAPQENENILFHSKKKQAGRNWWWLWPHRAQLFAWHELLTQRRMARITKRGRGRPGEQALPFRYHHPS